ncbi:CBN-TIAR-2 protein [Caenorhabditis brenneri]|uniref:CBN-TIAR-2 protein n=1 Tax=Caenorhabditis brenneri TaxID=135651 RepID=G0MCQ7_CAEBE|nr:CBN-TIAR-2 protein [Caenorhabditis brenneri]
MSSYYSSGDDFVGYNPRVHARVAEKEGYQLASGSEDPRTLFVGNLDPAVTDEFIATLFNQMGAVTKAKIIFDFQGLADPYAFIEFSDHNQAAQALQSMNGRQLLDRELRVNWAVEPNQPGDSSRKMDYSRHFHVFVGDLSSEIDSTKLKEAFLPFGEVSEAKIIRDTTTNKAKGYGFVSYPRREDAERAIEQMNGQWLGRRTIRTNWASRKPGEEGERRGGGFERDRERGERFHGGFEKTYDEIFHQTSPDNTSVYVGQIGSLTEDEIRRAFDRFGAINEVRIFKLQGYAFVKFEQKEPAARAIVQMNNTEIMGQMVRCSWGKSGDAGNKPSGGGYGYGYGGSEGRTGGGGPPPFAPGFNPAPGGGRPGSGGPPGSASQQSQYWQYYAQYYNNPQLMAQWNNYWQGAKQGPPPNGGSAGN